MCKIYMIVAAALLVSAAGAQTPELELRGNELHLIGGADVAALQFEHPAGVMASAGADLATAGKDLTCDVPVSGVPVGSTDIRCLIVGLNQNQLSGHIATVDGPVVFTAILGTDAEASAGFEIPIFVISACDVTGDRVTDVDDLLAVTSDVRTGMPCRADIDGDGICTIVDAQRVANAAVTGTCVEGP